MTPKLHLLAFTLQLEVLQLITLPPCIITSRSWYCIEILQVKPGNTIFGALGFILEDTKLVFMMRCFALTQGSRYF